MKIISVTKADSGQTLIKYLRRILPGATPGLLYKQLRNKNITLNGKKSDGSDKLAESDEIKLFFSDETFEKFSVAEGNKENVEADRLSLYRNAFKKFGSPEIIFEDEHVIVFYKPVGILSQQAESKDYSANEWILGYLLNKHEITEETLKKFTPSVCNRLDRNTAGLMLFGKTLFGANLLNRIIKDKSLKKYYKTLVKGEFSKEGLFTSYMVKDSKTNKVTVFDSPVEGSVKTEAEFKAVKYLSRENLTEVEVLLFTGKTHQIRAELNHLGFPVAGDVKYTDNTGNSSSSGHCLIAYRLVFPELPEYAALSCREFKIGTSDYLNKFINSRG